MAARHRRGGISILSNQRIAVAYSSFSVLGFLVKNEPRINTNLIEVFGRIRVIGSVSPNIRAKLCQFAAKYS
jgi:hypothetical protein